MALAQDEQSVSGRLSLASGEPVAGARVTVTATPLDGEGVRWEYRYSGTVPASANSIAFGLRVNRECECSGASEFSVSRFRYREIESSQAPIELDFSRGLQGWNVPDPAIAAIQGGELHVSSKPQQQLMLNSRHFPATPGARYEFSVSARVAPESVGSGYFALLFLNGKESARVRLPLQPPDLPLGSATTAKDGSWRLALSSLGDGSGRFQLRGDYAGSQQYWPCGAGVIYPTKKRD